jgi:DNA polymerase/3'-5' exonuclease PolX
MTPTKKNYDRALAIRAAKNIVDRVMPVTERIVLAGSLRRRRMRVSDIEILYIPAFKDEQVDLLTVAPVNQFDKELERLIKEKVIAKRKNVLGSEVWGEKNKLAVHCKSGIPVDFFATTAEAWYNYLVCRTGGALNNTLIAEAYQRHGCKWNPYSPGFTDKWGDAHQNKSEADVYENCELVYLHPWQRP